MAPALLVPLHTPVELCVQSSTDASLPLHSREKSEVLREERGKWDPETGMAPGGREGGREGRREGGNRRT